MAPKETKKNRERRLKKAEEQLRGAGAEATDAATDAPTDSPTDDDEPEEPLLYDAEGGLMRPGTSAVTAAAAPNNAVAKAGASPTFSTSDSSDGIAQEKGSARARTGTTGTKAKRASTRSSRSRSKAPKKAKKSKKARRRRKIKSSSSSSLDDRRRGRGRSPSTDSSSSASSSGNSNWEEFYDNATVAKVRELLKTPPPTRATRCIERSVFI
jgi:hypothetical protein